MRRNDTSAFDLIVESVTAFGIILYLGLQIFYRMQYEIRIGTMIYHVLPMVLLYTWLLLLQFHPEFLNGWGGGEVYGKVRVYAVRMVRNCKFLVVYGILLPSAADVFGFALNDAYSLILMACILAVIAYYLYRIYQYNKSQNNKEK